MTAQFVSFRRVLGIFVADRALRGLGALAFGLLFALQLPSFSQTSTTVPPHFDEIGINQLRNALGNNAPDGTGVFIAQIEAEDVNGRYMPDQADYPDLPLNNRSDVHDGLSNHAKQVGRWLYGVNSVAPNIDGVNNFGAGDWYTRTLLRLDVGGEGPPLATEAKIQNHSWVAVHSDDTSLLLATKILRLLDYVIERDHVVSVVSLQNGESAIPDLLSHAYNVITVGKSNGDHSSGKTLFDGTGRGKPDLVAPTPFTSYAVPLVVGTAALLVQGARQIEDPQIAAMAERPEVIKALLMAGCTITEFPDWTSEWYAPLDPTHGAGELNAYNAWRILDAGRAAATTRTTAPVPEIGWDFGKVTGNETLIYQFNVPRGYKLSDLASTLTWHRQVTDTDRGPSFVPDISITDLDLTLRGLGDLNGVVDESRSGNDNVELIRWPELPAGSYQLEIKNNDTRAQDFGFAWRGDLIPLPRAVNFEAKADSRLTTFKVIPGQTYLVQTTRDFKTWETRDSITPTDEQVTIPVTDDQEMVSCRLVLE